MTLGEEWIESLATIYQMNQVLEQSSRNQIGNKTIENNLSP